LAAVVGVMSRVDAAVVHAPYTVPTPPYGRCRWGSCGQAANPYVDPFLGRVVSFDQIGQVHWEMG
jgi:hypothetical protein